MGINVFNGKWVKEYDKSIPFCIWGGLRKGIKVDILFAGNTAAVSEGFYNAIDREYRCVVLNNALAKDKLKKKNIIFFKSSGDEDTEHIFRSFDFETVVFFSQALDGEKKIFDELEKLEYILYLCRKRSIGNFIYITGNRLPDDAEDGEASRAVLLNACEQLCHRSADSEKINVQLLRMPYLYHTVIKTSHVGRWLEMVLDGKALVLPGYEDTETDFVREDDLALLLNRLFDDPWEEPYLDTNVSGRNKLTFGELAAVFSELAKYQDTSAQVAYSGKDECTPTCQKDDWARREYGWIPRADIKEDLRDAAQNYIRLKRKRKNRALERFMSNRLLRVTVEQLVLFMAAEALNYVTRNNIMFNFLDFRLVYIAIIACMNGLGPGAAAAVFAGAGCIISNISAVSWQVLFFNVQNWLPFACYLLLGCVLGYNTDKAQDEIKSRVDEYKLLEEKYAFLHELYTEVAQGKERFNNQIIGYKDSFGKMYSVVKKLNTTLPEMVFYEAVDICEEVLGNSHVAIYSIRPGSPFARLYVCSKRCIDSAGRSLKITDYPKLLSSLKNNETFVNREAIEGYPAYATPINRAGVLVGMILIMDADYSQMNIEFSNKLRIMSDMIQDSLVRALEFYEMNGSRVENTRILDADKFEEVLNVKRQMRKKQYLDYVLLKIESNGSREIAATAETPQGMLAELGKRLGELVRENDVMGLGEDGSLYLLLSQTGRNDIKTVAGRLRKNGIVFEEVSESE